MHKYIPNTAAEKKSMLESIGASSIEDLFSDIPAELKLGRELNLDAPMSELEVERHMNELAAKNKSDFVCFRGAGAYDHYIPSVIKHLTLRQEFFTAYTPYQPEISQGTLQMIFEFQTMLCDLTGMDVANASMYDVGTAAVEAAVMAVQNKKKSSNVVVSKGVHPETRLILHTYLKQNGIEVIEVDTVDGVTDMDKLAAAVGDETAGVIVQNPNFFGIFEDVEAAAEVAHGKKALLVDVVDPISLGIVKRPGDIGADIVVGDAQCFGNALNFGGPYIGFLTTKSKMARKMPGRIVGQTEDTDGKRGFVLTLQAREQHIRREKATSNICSNQGLCALTVAIYLSTMGKSGLREVALQCMNKAQYAYKKLTESGKFKPLYNKPFFKEFALTSGASAADVNAKLAESNILGGYELECEYPEAKNGLLFCVTEKRTKEEIDCLAQVMEVNC